MGLNSTCPCSSVAEHSLGKGEVASSILAMGSIIFWPRSQNAKGTLRKGKGHVKK